MLTDKDIGALKAKHPGADLYMIDEGDSAIVVRVPTQGEWKAFKAMAREGGNKAIEAPSWLVGVCRVWPEAAAAEAIFNRKPGLVDTCANKIAEYAGVDEKISAKKL